MNPKKKKSTIVLLLLISCVASILLLLYSDKSDTKYLESFATVDSLIQQDLNQFNIPARHVEAHTIKVDSTFSRRNYRIAVPPGFSKTQLHAEMQNSFYPYQVNTPAKVLFPHKDFRIHLLYKETVIRSITLTTDPELELNRNFGSILVAFDKVPSQSILDEIISFGEPISIALIVENPLQANDMKAELGDKYGEIVYWLRDKDGNNTLTGMPERILPKLQHLQDALPDARVLNFMSEEEASNKFSSQTKLKFIDASDAILLDPESGKATFMQKMTKFSQEARNYEKPMAVIMGSKKSLQWLREELPDLKKAGLKIIPIQQINQN